MDESELVRNSVKVDYAGGGFGDLFFELTRRGQQKFLSMTRELAKRGAALHRAQHFTIAINGRIYGNPAVDYRIYPNGLGADMGLQVVHLRLTTAQRLAYLMRRGVASTK